MTELSPTARFAGPLSPDEVLAHENAHEVPASVLSVVAEFWVCIDPLCAKIYVSAASADDCPFVSVLLKLVGMLSTAAVTDTNATLLAPAAVGGA